MREKEFEKWLHLQYPKSTHTVFSRFSNCRTVERKLGDLDLHYETDRAVSVLSLLSYSKEDERNNIEPAVLIIKKGNIYNGLATLRQAVRRYVDFRNDEIYVL
ncbi:MAG: hypothetical protein WCP52_10550 [Bacteroidota bacterium]